MNMPIRYITPRLGIISIDPSTDIHTVLQTLKNLHAHYYHVFNLSSFNLDTIASQYAIPHTNFKWRQVPYSISQAIKILSTLQSFLRPNIANSAFFAVSSYECQKYCEFIIQAYVNLLGCSKPSLCGRQNILHQFSYIYKNIRISSPPVKVIQAVQFGSESFIPLYQILTQTRHNNFEPVYLHEIQQQLGNYYLQKKRPLQKGLGSKFCDKKPETKHLLAPCLVFGDVKLIFHSFDRHVLQKQFICGFNTKSLQLNQTVVTINASDYYQITNPHKIAQNHSVRIYLSDYCQKCRDKAQCKECLEITKKIHGRYVQVQTQLEKLHRKRSGGQCKTLLGINNN